MRTNTKGTPTPKRTARQQCHCGATVLWCDTTNDMRIKVDALPSTEGTYHVDQRADGTAFARPVPAAEQAGRMDLHRSHYMTCGAGQFQRPRFRS